MTCSDLLSRIRIVLVSTQHPGNIGAVARAMLTMGLKRLVLVRPRQFPHEQTWAMASGAVQVLDDAVVYDDLGTALAGCTRVYATTARRRGLAVAFTTPRAMAETLASGACGGDIAVVFGAERTGLTNEELALCHEAVCIAANPDYSALNIAAAVQVVAYELRQAALQTAAMRPAHVPAPHEALEHFYGHLERTLIATGFLDPSNPRLLMRRLRRLFARAAPDSNEVNILRGILTSVEETSASGHPARRAQTANRESP
jgi:TrmH family RNA methyltransferase